MNATISTTIMIVFFALVCDILWSQEVKVEGSLKIDDGTQNKAFVLTSDSQGLASWQKAYPFESNPFENSSIIDSLQGQLINQWIGNSSQKWEKCYDKSTDAASAATFHTNCNYRGPTVTVVELSNGRKFGGYTEVSWTYTSEYRPSYAGFIFSIDNEKKYFLSNLEFATYNHPNYGPTFGNGHDFYIDSSMNLGYANFAYGYSYGGSYATPTNAATQELAGVNRLVPLSATHLEVWMQTF